MGSIQLRLLRSETTRFAGRESILRVLARHSDYVVTFFVVHEGSVDTLEPPPDDEAALFREVRRDRKLRALKGSPEEPGSAPSEN